MKYELIRKNIKQYKTELHCHSNVSDGKFSPSELKKLYKERGFSVVAFTDHDIFVTHNDLTDDNFIALNGYELCVPTFCGNVFERERQPHLNFYAKDQKNDRMLFYNHELVYQKNAKAYIGKIAFIGEEEKRINSVEWLNYAISKADENGYIVTYNHPVWSLSQPKDYLGIKGLFAMEVWNTGSFDVGGEDGAAFREMIFDGAKLNCVATNDFHNFHENYDSMQAAVYVLAEEFNYNGIIDALSKGNFYSSCGPKITELIISDGKVKIECDGVSRIDLITCRKDNKSVFSKNEDIYSAEFAMEPALNTFFYFILTDKNGNKAWTNPVWGKIDE